MESVEVIWKVICSVLVFFMQAGFAMLESGLVRSKNTATICLKNIALYSIAGLMFYLIGYNLMYQNVAGGYFGEFQMWSGNNTDALAGKFDAKAKLRAENDFTWAVIGNKYLQLIKNLDN